MTNYNSPIWIALIDVTKHGPIISSKLTITMISSILIVCYQQLLVLIRKFKKPKFVQHLSSNKYSFTLIWEWWPWTRILKIYAFLRWQTFYATISFIFWDFLMFYQIFLSPQAKRLTIITYKHGIYEVPHELPKT